MKLIIKIPEHLYSVIKNKECTHNNVLTEAVFNGTPLEEEIEKIKAEIEEIKSLRDNPYNKETEYSVSTKELRELLDKHIAELKGENK